MAIELMALIPIPGIFLGTVALSLIACEAGFQLGHYYRHTWPDKEAPNSIGAMVAGLLSTLAFVLALTFTMAVGQYQVRNQNVVAEAAAIHSAYLLADLVEADQQLEIKRLLRRYTAVRLQVAQDLDLKSAISKSLQIYQLLWVQTTAVVVMKSDDVAAMMAQSIIGVISLGEQRKVAAVNSQIPESVWFGLLIITLLSIVTLGVQLGLFGRRRLVAVLPLSIAFAVLVTLVVDLDRPQSGFITVSQSAMADLQIMMDRY